MSKQPDNVIRDQAADWVTRIQSGEINPENSAELRAWLDSDPEHAGVFRQMLEVFSASGRVAELYEGERPSVQERRFARPRFALAAAASALLAVAAVLWLFSSPALVVETQTGERILMTLEDGSSVHLNSLSSIEVAFTDDARVVRMPGGEVLFDVNDEDPRPFLVYNDAVEVEVTGTTFQVTQYGADATVAVLEGRVRVRESEAEDGQAAIELVQGEQVLYLGAALGDVMNADLARLTGWREGWLYLDGQPLQDLIDRLNRHYDGRIEISDPDLARSAVTVALKLDRRADTLARLERLLPLRVEELSGYNRSLVHPRR